MKGGNDKSLKRALSANRESKYLDFKESFDPTKPEGWCEIVKDIVSMANSGGGMIAIGVKNNGSPPQGDISTVLSLDPAQVTDKIAKYTGNQFGDITIQEAERDGHKIAVLQISCASIPMVFIEPGTYDIGGGKQKTAFSRGSIYFRHGAKSEPGNFNDLRDSVERELERIKKSWLGNIRKMVSAPPTYKAVMLPPEVKESDLINAVPIRIVDDPNAPAYRK
ncbi:MAG TPA: AlbA family DNA-binding domain-containing protein, partial [Candidatus Hypogeohydataceae bacterium YC40]